MRLKDSFAADPAGLSLALRFAERFAGHVVMPRGGRARLLLVVEEVLVNIVAHGAPPAGSWIDLELVFAGTEVEIRVTDGGAAFDPRVEIPMSSRDVAVGAGVEGGVGWPMILRWSAIKVYERKADRNHLTLSLNLVDQAANR